MDKVFETFRTYMGSGLVMGLFLLALVYLYFFEKRRPRRILFVYTPILLLALFFTPLFATVFENAAGMETYFRLCWNLPYIMVLPYTAVVVVEQLKGKRAFCTAAAFAALLVVSGKLVYTNSLYSRAENIYHVPDSVVHICDAIEVPGREVMAVFPRELLLYVRQYSPVVCMPYGREVFMGTYSEMYEVMEADEIDLGRLLPLTREKLCHYIVLRQDAKLTEEPAGQGLELFFETDGYMIYRDNAVILEIPDLNGQS